jgi:hypothetical protein
MKCFPIFLLYCIVSHNLYSQIEAVFERQTSSVDMRSEFFCFKKTGQFEFVAKGDLSNFKESGLYKINGDTLILNSLIRLQDLILIKQRKGYSRDSIYFIIKLKSNDPVYFTKIVFDSSEYVVPSTPIQGNIKIPKTKNQHFFTINSLLLPWKLSKKKFEILDDNNVLEIILDESEGYSGYFWENEKYILKQNYFVPFPEVESDFIYTKTTKVECN